MLHWAVLSLRESMLLQSVNNLSSVGGGAGGGGSLGISCLSVSFSLLSTLVGVDQSSSCLSD